MIRRLFLLVTSFVFDDRYAALLSEWWIGKDHLMFSVLGTESVLTKDRHRRIRIAVYTGAAADLSRRALVLRPLVPHRAAFAVGGEKQEPAAADKATLVLLKGFSRILDVKKARVEFERAQKVDGRFHSEFDRLDGSLQSVVLV